MQLAEKENSFIKEHISFVEKELKKNLEQMNWKIEHAEEFRSLEGNIVKVFVGITSEFGGVTTTSFLSHGGGYTPFYLKLTEVDHIQTNAVAVVTGSETIDGDYGNRNGKVAMMLVEMCQRGYKHVTLQDKIKGFFTFKKKA